MIAKKSASIETLAQLSGQEIDQVLLMLWDNGIDDVTGPKSIIIGNKLLYAKRVLGIPTGNQLNSLRYWQTLFSINEKQLRELLSDLKVSMSEKARKLPQGAIRKLKSEAQRRNKNLQTVSDKTISLPVEELLNEVLHWRTVGHREEFISLMSVEEVLKIHYALAEDFSNNYDPIDPPGPRNDDILSSAIFSPLSQCLLKKH